MKGNFQIFLNDTSTFQVDKSFKKLKDELTRELKREK